MMPRGTPHLYLYMESNGVGLPTDNLGGASRKRGGLCTSSRTLQTPMINTRIEEVY